MKPGTVIYFPAQEKLYAKANSSFADHFFDLYSFENALLDLNISLDNPRDWIEYPNLQQFLKALGWTKLPEKESRDISRRMAHSLGLDYGPDVWHLNS